MDIEIKDEVVHTLSFIKEAETAPEVIVDIKDNIDNEGDAKGTDSVEETKDDPHARVEVGQVPPPPPCVTDLANCTPAIPHPPLAPITRTLSPSWSPPSSHSPCNPVI